MPLLTELVSIKDGFSYKLAAPNGAGTTRQHEWSIRGAIYHVMDRGDRREDILLIGTAQAAKSWLHHLAHEPPQHKSARFNEADGQLEFQSAG